MAWFGHTQTLTSISKSVTTVASGILGLEDNLATFMKKVIYYDKFFQRVCANLPKEVASTAALLFARCYEYRDEIRDELESSLAYVADAGRWVVGMEDWNSKMDKRAHQISELVLLANSLLAEYAMSGRLGGEGSKDELDAYLRNIAASVVLRNQKPAATATRTAATPTSLAPTASSSSTSSPSSLSRIHQQQMPERIGGGGGSSASSNGDSASASVESLQRDPDMSLQPSERSRRLEPGMIAVTAAAAAEGDCDGDGGDNDNDAFNPFALAYQQPASAKQSLASSLASLANESTHSSILDLSTYDTESDSRQLPRRGDGADTTDDDDNGDSNGDGDGETPDSPVNLHEYECLDLESIPKYSVFRPAMRSRQQRLSATLSASASMTRSMGSLASRGGSGVEPLHASNHISSSFPSLRHGSTDSSTGAPLFGVSHSTAPLPSVATETVSRGRRPHQLMDMTYSYDFQREQANNPFVSPPAAVLLPPSPLVFSDPLELAGIAEDDATALSHEVTLSSQDAGGGDDDTGGDEAESSPVWPELTSAVRQSDEDEDETSALIAAIAAAADDDYNLFGTGHAS